MLRFLGLLILVTLAAPLPADAADAAVSGKIMRQGQAAAAARIAARAFPLSRRARDVRNADTCWRSCQADAGAIFQTCLRRFPPTVCVPSNDAADRFCLRNCRISGGPWLNLAD
jgi:hypothetical protein